MLFALPASALENGDDFEYEGIWYTVLDADAKTVKTKDGSDESISDGRYFYSYPGNNVSGDVVIPAIVSDGSDSYTVTAIGNGSFYGNNLTFTSIIIPDGVTSIGHSAFSGCFRLSSINIPDGVTFIGCGAFASCSELTSIDIPESVTFIGSRAFWDCSGLNCSINIPNGVTSIEDYTFYWCSGLTDIFIPESVTSIGSAAFHDCRGLTSINIPNGVTTINQNTFSLCSGLTSINMGEGVTSIGFAAFNGCTGLTSFNIPKEVVSIENCAFIDCSGLTSINIPSGIKSIEYWAFLNCPGLTYITYEAEVPITVPSDFVSTSSYNQVTLRMPKAALADIEATPSWNQFGKIVAKDGSIGFDDPAVTGTDFEYEGLFYTVIDSETMTAKTRDGFDDEPGNSFSGDLVIPDIVYSGSSQLRVVEIGSQGFAGSSNLNSISLPSTIESIGNDAFAGCDRLTSLIWRGDQKMPNVVLESIDNPNLLVYVDSVKFAPEGLDHNIVADGVCESLVLTPGYPFTPVAEFTAKTSSMTKEFEQITGIGGCSGWETIVLPFDVAKVISPEGHTLLPYSIVTDARRQRPYWLYEADPAGEWQQAEGIKSGVPYLVSMPNNPRYNPAYNISGHVTFSNPTPQCITPESTAPYAVTWTSGREFRSLWLPLDETQAAVAMGLNVNIDNLTDDNGEVLAPGSAFHAGIMPKPLEAYVTRNGGAHAFRISGIQSAVLTVPDSEDLKITYDEGILFLQSSDDRMVDIYSADGTLLRRVTLKAGQPVYVDDLPQGVCLIARHKVMIL